MIPSQEDRELLKLCLQLLDSVMGVGLNLGARNSYANGMVMDLVSMVLLESSGTLLNYESSIQKAASQGCTTTSKKSDEQ